MRRTRRLPSGELFRQVRGVVVVVKRAKVSRLCVLAINQLTACGRPDSRERIEVFEH